MLGEGADHAEPAQRLAVQPEREGAARQLPAGDGGALVAEVGPAGRAEPAVPAGGQEAGDDVVAGGHAGHARPDGRHDAGALVPADDRVPAARVGVPQVLVGVAEAGVRHLDQHLARPGVEDLELDDLVLGLRLGAGPLLSSARRSPLLSLVGRPCCLGPGRRPSATPRSAPGARVRHHRRVPPVAPHQPTEACPGCGAVLVRLTDVAPSHARAPPPPAPGCSR